MGSGAKWVAAGKIVGDQETFKPFFLQWKISLMVTECGRSEAIIEITESMYDNNYIVMDIDLYLQVH